MFRALLALFRPLYTIAKEMSIIRELYELELQERDKPIVRITSKPKKGDVEVTYQDDNTSPRWKQVQDEWDEGPDEEDVR